MKRKRVAVLLSAAITLTVLGSPVSSALATEFSDNAESGEGNLEDNVELAEKVLPEKEEVSLSDEEEFLDEDLTEAGTECIEEIAESEISDENQESEEMSAEEKETIVVEEASDGSSSQEEDTALLSESSVSDEQYNFSDSESAEESSDTVEMNVNDLKNYCVSSERTRIMLGEYVESGIKVSLFQNGTELILDADNYAVIGYITEAEFQEKNYNLDDDVNFQNKPDEAGTWLMVLEGKNSYYGRQAVWITVCSPFDLSIYNWLMETDGIWEDENPEEYLDIYYENEKGISQLGQENYFIKGYISEEDYVAAGSCLENLTTLKEKPDGPGKWGIVLEGREPYFGQQIVWTSVKDSFNLSIYQNQSGREQISVGEDCLEYIQLCRTVNGEQKILDTADYRALGYIQEEQYMDSGYKLDSIQSFYQTPDSEGNWFLVLEGNAPYYGRIVAWVSVNEQTDQEDSVEIMEAEEEEESLEGEIYDVGDESVDDLISEIEDIVG